MAESNDPVIRLFVAIYPSDEARQVLGATIGELEQAVPGLGRWVRPERVHLTLRFFGDVPRSSVDAILPAMNGATESWRRGGFQLHLSELGTFGGPKSPRVIWAGVGGDMDALRDLHGALDRELVRAGFAPDRQPYRPHLTLGRPRNARNRTAGRTLSDTILGWPHLPAISWKSGAIHLIHSVLPPEPPEYICLGSSALTAGSTGEATT